MKRTTSLVCLTAGIALFLVAGGSAVAQDSEDDAAPATWGDDARYLRINYVKFKPGKRERALQIIDEHFAKAARAANRPGPAIAVHFQSGEWDAMWGWVLDGGTKDLEWYRSPGAMDWWAELVKQEGGEEQAGALWQEYMDSVRDSRVEIGHDHPPAK